jgi:hypothetical protein
MDAALDMFVQGKDTDGEYGPSEKSSSDGKMISPCAFFKQK